MLVVVFMRKNENTVDKILLENKTKKKRLHYAHSAKINKFIKYAGEVFLVGNDGKTNL